MKNSFNDRIDLVLNGRKLTPWCKGLGIPAGTIGRISSGNIPSDESLLMIYITERLSRDWLMDGKGTPYHVTKSTYDDEFEEETNKYLDDENWQVTIAHGSDKWALVLTMPVEKHYKKVVVKYTEVEVLVGPPGPAITRRLQSHGNIQQLALDAEQMQALISGQMGNYELLGDDKKRSLLADALPWDPDAIKLPEGGSCSAFERLVRICDELNIKWTAPIAGLVDAIDQMPEMSDVQIANVLPEIDQQVKHEWQVEEEGADYNLRLPEAGTSIFNREQMRIYIQKKLGQRRR